MIVFEIDLNGTPYCRAGIEPYGVMSVGLHWIDFDGAAITGDRDHPAAGVSLSVAGHRSERSYGAADVEAGADPPPTTHVHWGEVSRGLQVGDEVRIRIAEADLADEPTETPRLPDLGRRAGGAAAENTAAENTAAEGAAAGSAADRAVRRADEAREYFSGEGCHILELSGAGNDPALSIARARVEPGVTTQLHALDGVYERYLVVAGRGEVELGAGGAGEPAGGGEPGGADQPAKPDEPAGVREAVAPGDVVLIPPGVAQRITNTGEEDLVFYCLCTPPWRPDAYRTLES